MKYNPEIHHRRSIRFKNYDYSTHGYYYITICSRNRECIFSNISSSDPHCIEPPRFELTDLGNIVDFNWQAIPNRFKNVFIDEYIIMPNHLHGIILLSPEQTARIMAPSLGVIIGSFKSICTSRYLKYIRENELNALGKIWQRNYYERIIRNEEELHQIRQYIINNPAKWADDEENPINILKSKSSP